MIIAVMASLDIVCELVDNSKISHSFSMNHELRTYHVKCAPKMNNLGAISQVNGYYI